MVLWFEVLPINIVNNKWKKEHKSMTANPGKKSKFERFHGAFTGGFSAGYFNTVGSENNAGFQPSTFVSSRSNRSVHSIYLLAPSWRHTSSFNRAPVDLVMQRKEHYMDDEDGLLGGHLSTKQVHMENVDLSLCLSHWNLYAGYGLFQQKGQYK